MALVVVSTFYNPTTTSTTLHGKLASTTATTTLKTPKINPNQFSTPKRKEQDRLCTGSDYTNKETKTHPRKKKNKHALGVCLFFQRQNENSLLQLRSKSVYNQLQEVEFQHGKLPSTTTTTTLNNPKTNPNRKSNPNHKAPKLCRRKSLFYIIETKKKSRKRKARDSDKSLKVNKNV